MLAREIAIAAGMVRKTEGEKRGMIENLSSVECSVGSENATVGLGGDAVETVSHPFHGGSQMGIDADAVVDSSLDAGGEGRKGTVVESDVSAERAVIAGELGDLVGGDDIVVTSSRNHDGGGGGGAAELLGVDKRCLLYTSDAADE